MKPHTCPSVLKIAAFALALGYAALAHAGEKLQSPADAAVTKSVFVDDPRVGKDPFFPNSTRRTESLARLAVTNVVAPANFLLDQVFLKGISGPKEQRLALINSVTVAVGEKAELKVGQQTLKLRCREIRERSVVVELDGSNETKELKLRENI